MTVLRSLLLLLAMALAPLQPAWSTGMQVAPMANTHTMPAKPGAALIADCCQEGGHQNPGCQSVPALPDIPHITLPAPNAQAAHPAPTQERGASRNPDQPLRPPIPA